MIRNLFGVDLVVTDRYPAAEAFDGGIAYDIAAGGRVTIRSTVFRDQTIEHGETQDIVVKRADGGEMAPLILSHVDFYQNRGGELLLEMGENGVLSHRFVPPVGNGRRSLAQIIWYSPLSSKSSALYVDLMDILLLRNNLTIPFRRLQQLPPPGNH